MLSKTTNTLVPYRAPFKHKSHFCFGLAVLVLFFTLDTSSILAQHSNSSKRQKLPSPEKIVNDYLKAIGGKKRVAAIKDATYEWTAQSVAGPKSSLRGGAVKAGRATTHIKTPSSTHSAMDFNDDRSAEYATKSVTNPRREGLGRSESGANARSAWNDGVFILDGLQTLTDMEGLTARLQSMLDASHLVDFKKSKVLARTAGIEESSGDPAYIVEFSLRNGARLRYWFSVASKLLLASENKTQITRRYYRDYRELQGLLEPHQVILLTEGAGELTLNLQRVRYNTGLSDTLFDPPATESIDVVTLLSEVDRNQEQVDERVGDYTYTEKLTERKINDKGEVTEETIKTFEVYPLPGRYDVHKLISENGVLLSPEKAAKEDKRVIEELEKADRERTKAAEKLERDRQKGKTGKPDNDPGIADFLRAAELVSPRRERLRDRDSIVFDFRPRPGYKPKGNVESIVSKLAGVVWIDPVDKQVMRLEARLVDSYKMGGGLLASVRPGTALVFEQKRMDDGVWLPVYTQVNISAKVLLFKSLNMNVVQEFSNYQRFKSNVDDYKLTSPAEKSKASPGP